MTSQVSEFLTPFIIINTDTLNLVLLPLPLSPRKKSAMLTANIQTNHLAVSDTETVII